MKVNIQCTSISLQLSILNLYFLNVILLSILTVDRGSENKPVEHHSSAEVQKQDIETSVASDFQEEAPPAQPSEVKSQQDPSHLSADEEPTSPQTETPNNHTQITVNLTALTEEEEERLSDSPLAVTDVNTPDSSDPHHLEITVDDSDLTGRGGGGGDESDECTEGPETERIITEENIHIPASTTVSTAAAEGQQEDLQLSQETQLSDETDVCVGQEV